MFFIGIIKEVFIPGYRDYNDITRPHIEAGFVGFVVEILSYESLDCSHDLDIPHELIIIEKDTEDSAGFYVKDKVKVSYSVVKGYDGWDGYNRVFLNFGNAPCIEKMNDD